MPTQTVAATETLTAEEIKAKAEAIIEDLKQYADQAEADRRLCKEVLNSLKTMGYYVLFNPNLAAVTNYPFVPISTCWRQ